MVVTTVVAMFVKIVCSAIASLGDTKQFDVHPIGAVPPAMATLSSTVVPLAPGRPITYVLMFFARRRIAGADSFMPHVGAPSVTSTITVLPGGGVASAASPASMPFSVGV